MLKGVLINSSIQTVKNQYPNLDQEKIEKIKYGIEGIYLTVSKLVIIFLLALILDIVNEVFLFMIIFASLRMIASGVHATNSLSCLIISLVIFIGLPLILKIIIIPLVIKLSLCGFSLFIYGRYAPADTKKRPLISPEKRVALKMISLLMVLMASGLVLIIRDEYTVNLLLGALVIQGLLIMPITYRLSNQTYSNYQNNTITEN
ncbi:MAG: accessory gene regulator B family protein [Bacilli bacterium]|jgi:accessory gene regulator B|nr:accessory gene regulator B family protein [Bacilli bacterium]